MARIVYTKKHLLEALKEAGLPHSYRSLLKYEKMGIIPRDHTGQPGLGADGLQNISYEMRFYSLKNIESIVEKIRKFKAS